MPSVKHYPIHPEDIQARLVSLKKRQRGLSVFGIAALSVCALAVLFSFTLQPVIYGFFDLSTQIKQLHIPAGFEGQLFVDEQPDYLITLLSWLGWLILKLTVSFFGAFIFVRLLKKFRFFKVRFKSLILRFVAWLIGWILIWSGLTFLQYHQQSDEAQAYAELVQYDQRIQTSPIFQYLQQARSPQPVKDYLLAQTALLHRPIDKDAAVSYTSSLIRAERTDPHFFEYGLKREQLWTIQHQVYGKSITPMAQSIDAQARQAARISEVTQRLSWGLSFVAFLVGAILYGLNVNIKARIRRIEARF